MSEPRSFLDGLLNAIIEAIEPLEQALEDPILFEALLEDLGWVLDPGPTDTGTLQARIPVAELMETARAGVEAIREGEASAELYAALTESTLAIVELLRSLDAGAPPTLPPPLDEPDFWASLALDLVSYLVVRQLRRTKPVAYAVLHLFGIVDYDAAPANERRLDGHRRVVLRWDRLGTLFSAPQDLASEVYGWGGDLEHVALLERLEDSLTALGLPASLPEPDAGTIDTYYGSPTAAAGPERELRLMLASGTASDGVYAEVGLSVLAIPAPGSAGPPLGLLISLYAEGSAELTIALSESVSGRLVGVVDADRLIGVELRPGVVDVADTAAVDVRAGIDLTYAPPQPALLFGGREGTRGELASVAIGLVGEAGTSGFDIGIHADVTGFALVVSLADADAFLGSLIGDGEIALRADLGISWSQRNGLRVTGQAELRFDLPLMLTLGPIELQRLLVSLGYDGTALAIAAAITARGKLGPLVLVVEEVGAALRFVPDPAGVAGGLSPRLAFKMPKGVGASVAAGPVTGGGYLFIDEAQGQYAGILQLKLPILGLTAIGLVTTRLPDGRDGFSLLVIITVDLPPIQLGYGFTLNGVGGLLGIHRTMVVDAIRDGVRTGALDSIMFPTDPIANAPRIISDLQRIFPPAENRFTFGPMVKLGWGPNALIELQLALILELPSPIRLAILGRIRIALPTKGEEAVVDLRLDVAGILDFGRSEASVDASLVDSRIAIFTLTGDMAMRLGWGATKAFALSAGGFNRRFQPPAGFPPLKRLALQLATGDNPRLRLETYFAVTSNTLQFGARVEVSAHAGSFGAVGSISFDTMIEFDPFHFSAELVGLISISLNDKPLLEARLEASLTGPSPWRVAGFVEVDFLGKHRIAVEATIGEPAAEILPLVDLHQVLVDELARATAWVALPPSGAASVVAVRDVAASDEVVVVHPLGSVALHQRALPFAKTLHRYGPARPERPMRFEVRTIRVGTAGGTPETILDDFAPGQYDELTDDEKLTRPAFEPMQAGGRAATPSVVLPAPDAAGQPVGVQVELGYDEAVVDAPTLPSRPTRSRRPRPLPHEVGAAVAGAGGQAVGLTTPDDLAVRVSGERFVAAHLDTLMAGEEATLHATSAAEAHDARAALGEASRDFAVVGAHEATS